MAGTLRAEATLAAANLVYLLLLLGGGIVIPLAKFPSGVQTVLGWLPSTALADALRTALADGSVRWGSIGVLAVWAVVALAGASPLGRPLGVTVRQHEHPPPLSGCMALDGWMACVACP